ncbi:hypothetical protein ACHAW6_005498 [Cyclotella cf. meneghiniana]
MKFCNIPSERSEERLHFRYRDFSLSTLSPGLLELLLAENGFETECFERAKEWNARKTKEWKRETKWQVS